MPSMNESVDHILAFVEAGVIHDDDTVVRKFGNEILREPGKEDIRINVAIK